MRQEIRKRAAGRLFFLLKPVSRNNRQSGCSAVGSALRSGRRGRPFESDHPDNREEIYFFSLFHINTF